MPDAGYHAVAPDQRGYGQSDRPEDIQKYTQLHLLGGVIGLLDALGEEQAMAAGHDLGAPIAWTAALMRPDRVRGVVGLRELRLALFDNDQRFLWAMSFEADWDLISTTPSRTSALTFSSIHATSRRIPVPGRLTHDGELAGLMGHDVSTAVPQPVLAVSGG